MAWNKKAWAEAAAALGRKDRALLLQSYRRKAAVLA